MINITRTLFLLLCISFGCNAYPGMQPQQKQMSANVGKISRLPQPYPIEAIPFFDRQGNTLDFSKFKGQVILVNFWATWCPPCVRELPELQQLSKEFDETQFKLLPISIDQGGTEQVLPFLASQRLNDFVSYYDPAQNLGKEFPLETIPATFILNAKGELIAFVRSYIDWNDPEVVKLLQSFIDKNEA